MLNKLICSICYGWLNQHQELKEWLKCGTCGFSKKKETMSITRKEMNPHNYPLTDEQERNQQILFIAINKLRVDWGKPIKVTSGVRSKEDQMRINPSAPNSRHLTGQAIDLADPDGSLYKWAFENQDKLATWKLWCEMGTTGWLHCQSIPPKSGNRFFKP